MGTHPKPRKNRKLHEKGFYFAGALLLSVTSLFVAGCPTSPGSPSPTGSSAPGVYAGGFSTDGFGVTPLFVVP